MQPDLPNFKSGVQGGGTHHQLLLLLLLQLQLKLRELFPQSSVSEGPISDSLVRLLYWRRCAVPPYPWEPPYVQSGWKSGTDRDRQESAGTERKRRAGHPIPSLLRGCVF